MPCDQVNAARAATRGGKCDKIAVRAEGGLLVTAGAKGHLALHAREHVLHKDAVAVFRHAAVHHKGAVGREVGFGVVGAVLAHPRDGAAAEAFR